MVEELRGGGWRSDTFAYTVVSWNLEAYTFKKNKVFIHRTQLLSRITFTVSLKINPVIIVYANVSDLHPPLSPNAVDKNICSVLLEVGFVQINGNRGTPPKKICTNDI